MKARGHGAKVIGEENGWQVRQVASQFRHPAHAPASPPERNVIDLFHRQPEITGLWQPATAEQSAGLNDDRRINVEPRCMACHGSKAFDFKVGDLQGMYAVCIAEIRAAAERPS